MSVEIVLIPLVAPIAANVIAQIVSTAVVGFSFVGAVTSVDRALRDAGIGEKEIANLERERERLERERLRLQSEEVLRKAREFRTVEEFNKWYAGEVAKFKTLEAQVVREMERIQLELEEKRRELQRKVDRARSVLTKCGVEFQSKQLSTTSELQAELEALERRVKTELDKLRKTISSRLATLPPALRAQAESTIAGQVKGLEDPSTHLEALIEISNQLSSLESYAQVLRNATEKIDLSKYKFDIAELKKTVERSTQTAQISELRNKILSYIELVEKLDERTAANLRKKFGTLESTSDQFYLQNVLDEVKIAYGTLKTEILESNAYRKLIEGMRQTYRNYPAIERLANEILALERIKDQDYKRFVEEMAKYLIKEKSDDAMKAQKKKIARTLQESLLKRGYELIVDEEDVDVVEALEAGKVIEISPDYSNDHFVKVKLREDGQVVFKFFKSEDSQSSFEEDLRFSKAWCENFKDIVGELNREVETQTLLTVEPEEVNEFSKARAARRRKLVQQKKEQTQQLQQKRMTQGQS